MRVSRRGWWLEAFRTYFLPCLTKVVRPPTLPSIPRMSSVILAIISVVEVVIVDSLAVRRWFDGGSTEVLYTSFTPLTMLLHVVGISSVYLRYDFGVFFVYT